MTCSSHTFRTKLLREKDLTLGKLIGMVRAKELAEKQTLNISGQNTSRSNIHQIKDEEKIRPPKYVPKLGKRNQCRNCGNEFKQGHKEVCPAKGKTNRSCGKLNHFAKVCRTSKNPSKQNKKDPKESVRFAQQSTKSPSNSSDDEYTFAVSSSKVTNVQIQINGTPIEVTIDSGATTNILDSVVFTCIKKRNKHVQLEPTQTNISAYNAV